MTRALIAKATREKHFRARAVRIDSTVIEADIQYPTDADLASHGVRALAREGRKLAAKIAATTATVRDRSRAMGRTLRGMVLSDVLCVVRGDRHSPLGWERPL
jgi:transposase, IS5 family